MGQRGWLSVPRAWRMTWAFVAVELVAGVYVGTTGSMTRREAAGFIPIGLVMIGLVCSFAGRRGVRLPPILLS